MALEGIDLAALKSWQEAFEYPLGATRQIEHRLRAEIASNRDRLRTLVGASYRDLLSTAERITHLDGSMQEADVSMSTLSRNCNSDALNETTQDAARLKQEETDKSSGSLATAAQILLLQKCRSCVTRLLRDHESSLLAAKVLSISRLLLKTLGQSSSPLPVLSTLRTQLASLRRHLLRRLDQRLSNVDTSHERLVEAICTFCLATSSSSSDALRHYHHLRLQEIRRLLELGVSEHENVIQALRYYTKSLQTSKATLGRSLSEALRTLGTRPILRDPVVNSLDELDLSTLKRWVAVEIQDFVPFIKHNDVAGLGMHSLTVGWSKEAFDILIQALKTTVKDVQSTTDLLGLRRALLEMWLPVCVSIPAHSGSEILETLRVVLNKRMNKLIDIEALTLTDIGTTIANIMSENSGMTRANSSIWDETFVTKPTRKGASAFKQQLRMRYLGTTDNISQILRSLDAWIAKVRATAAVVERLRKDRWRDYVEEDEDDEETISRIESLLQSDDPKLYEKEQASNFAIAFSDFQLKMSDTANVISQGSGCDQVPSLLRIIREMSQQFHQAFPEADLTMFNKIAPSLYSRLAIDVASKLLASSESRSASPRLSNMVSSHLWEGVPALPVQPSARIFRLLHKLQEAMAELGGDLWTQTAVGTLKKVVSERLVDHGLFDLDVGSRHGKDINGLTNGMIVVNGDSPKPSSSAHPSRIQDLFDVFYLNCALAPKQVDNFDQLAGIMQKLSALSELEESDVKAVRRRAQEYWARTNLLFGLLA